MARPIYSDRFMCIRGLRGSSTPVTVPVGETWIVKQLGAYAAPLVTNVHVFFHDTGTDGALWSQIFTPSASGNFFFYGAFCFREGESMDFYVDAADPTDGADVYAGGYRLLGTLPA